MEGFLVSCPSAALIAYTLTHTRTYTHIHRRTHPHAHAQAPGLPKTLTDLRTRVAQWILTSFPTLVGQLVAGLFLSTEVGL